MSGEIEKVQPVMEHIQAVVVSLEKVEMETSG